jgi:hypothetical protein
MHAVRRRRRLGRSVLPVFALFVAGERGASAQSGGAAPGGDPPPADSTPVEVVVRGPKPLRGDTIAADDLRAQDMRAVPGTFGDPFQAIAALPGVAATGSGLPYFYVRGAPPADTGYFLDGVPLPALYHVGPGPSYVSPALVDRIDFFPSAAPARFGRFAGGMIAATLAPPSATARGEGSLRMFDASAFAESPLDGATTALVAGRYGYPNWLLSLFAPGLSLGYGDYSARVVRELGADDALSLLAIGGFDHLVDASGQLPTVDSQFHRADVRYDHRWATGRLRVAATFGYDQSSRPFDTSDSNSSEIVRATSGRLRLEVVQDFGRDARLSAGADAVTTRYASEFLGGGASSTYPDSEQVFGAYADLTWRPAPRIELAPGLRLDAYRSTEGLTGSVEPRLAARVAVTREVTWVSTFGVARQEPAYVIPVPGLRIDPTGGLQAAYQIGEGAEVELPWSLRAKATAFFHADRKMSDYVSDCGTLASICNEVSRVDGRTYGLEVLLQRSFGQRLSGWLAYTLSRAERWIGNAAYLSPFDRTHVFSAVLTYDFGADVRAGVRATAYTGRPDFPAFYFGSQASEFAFGPGQLAQHRVPPFYRIDLKAEKRWRLGAHQWIAVVLDFFDATLTKEAIGFRCDIASGLCTAQEVGPVTLPSLGVEAGF